MSNEQQHGPPDAGSNEMAPEIHAALAQLAKARDYARDLQCDPWEFAVEIDRLTDLGLTASDLRWLVKKGRIEHAREVTGPNDAARRFEPRQNVAFTKSSCFLLADTGPEQPTDPAVPSPAAEVSTAESAGPPPKANRPPYWDADDRTLYWSDQVVKEYRVRSPNQEAVLSAFQEEGWPHYIDDPLSPVADQSPKQRLRDTIKCLNANQKSRLIRFRGDGTGERVRWELIEPGQK